MKSILDNKWVCFLYCCSLWILSASSQQQKLGEEAGKLVILTINQINMIMYVCMYVCMYAYAASQYVHDRKTTYCFKSSASIYESNVTREQILYQGFNDACPFSMTLTLDKQNVNIDEGLTIKWTISSNAAFISTKDPVVSSVVEQRTKITRKTMWYQGNELSKRKRIQMKI